MRRLLTAFLAATGLIAAGPPPELDRAIAGVRSAVERSGDRVWPGFARAPFGFLYVDADGETLLDDPRVPDGFARAADGRVSGPATWRKPTLLAAMPVFGPPSVIVMGSPQASGRDAAAWRRTIIHEHFHQWQTELPGYYARVQALGLAHGDQTGMWMLNYPFPYADPAVAAAHARASRALDTALSAPDGAPLRKAAADYLAQRSALKAAVTDEQWRYYDFQLWQEGVARWTEIEVAAHSGDAALTASADSQLKALRQELTHPDLAASQRVSVYALGGGEALLLDRLDPDWRGCYRVSLGLDPCWASLALEPAAVVA